MLKHEMKSLSEALGVATYDAEGRELDNREMLNGLSSKLIYLVRQIKKLELLRAACEPGEIEELIGFSDSDVDRLIRMEFLLEEDVGIALIDLLNPSMKIDVEMNWMDAANALEKVFDKRVARADAFFRDNKCIAAIYYVPIPSVERRIKEMFCV